MVLAGHWQSSSLLHLCENQVRGDILSTLSIRPQHSHAPANAEAQEQLLSVPPGRGGLPDKAAAGGWGTNCICCCCCSCSCREVKRMAEQTKVHSTALNLSIPPEAAPHCSCTGDGLAAGFVPPHGQSLLRLCLQSSVEHAAPLVPGSAVTSLAPAPHHPAPLSPPQHILCSTILPWFHSPTSLCPHIPAALPPPGDARSSPRLGPAPSLFLTTKMQLLRATAAAPGPSPLLTSANAPSG